MSDFTPTVTIPLAEYEQLKRDASPVRIWRDELKGSLREAVTYTMALGGHSGNATMSKFEQWVSYFFRCAMKGEQPTPMEEWAPKS